MNYLAQINRWDWALRILVAGSCWGLSLWLAYRFMCNAR
jgi:hypothetical protein